MTYFGAFKLKMIYNIVLCPSTQYTQRNRQWTDKLLRQVSITN